MKRILAGALLFAATFGASEALAAGKIHTGGEKGAYYGTFCPPLSKALARSRFKYECTKSDGTGDNIKKVLATPDDLGLVQLDTYARWAVANPGDAAKLTVVRKDIACEGLWMVTRNIDLNRDLVNLGAVAGGARRTPFVLPPQASGSTGTFSFLGELDKDGMGAVRARNISYAADTTTMLQEIAKGDGSAVGFFVQFADPTNPNIKLMVEQKLKVIPVVSRALLQAEADGQKVYEIQSFNLTAGIAGWGATKVETACTPVAIITGSPAAYKDQADQREQDALVKRVKDVPAADLLPADDKIASILKNATKISGAALDTMLTKADEAFKKAAEAAR